MTVCPVITFDNSRSIGVTQLCLEYCLNISAEKHAAHYKLHVYSV